MVRGRVPSDRPPAKSRARASPRPPTAGSQAGRLLRIKDANEWMSAENTATLQLAPA